jgi:hypothetical protein
VCPKRDERESAAVVALDPQVGAEFCGHGCARV